MCVPLAMILALVVGTIPSRVGNVVPFDAVRRIGEGVEGDRVASGHHLPAEASDVLVLFSGIEHVEIPYPSPQVEKLSATLDDVGAPLGLFPGLVSVEEGQAQADEAGDAKRELVEREHSRRVIDGGLASRYLHGFLFAAFVGCAFAGGYGVSLLIDRTNRQPPSNRKGRRCDGEGS